MCSKEKEFEDDECLLVYFRIYFIINGDISCMPTMSMYELCDGTWLRKNWAPKISGPWLSGCGSITRIVTQILISRSKHELINQVMVPRTGRS
jgi:hypothetical protein